MFNLSQPSFESQTVVQNTLMTKRSSRLTWKIFRFIGVQHSTSKNSRAPPLWNNQSHKFCDPLAIPEACHNSYTDAAH